jgi:hypothetical protein
VSGVSFLMLSVLIMAQPSSAIGFVNGKVMDQVGNPLEGANVTVNIYDSTMTLRDTLFCDATDEDGFYSVIFGHPSYEPAVGDTIEAIATYQSELPVSNSTVITTLCPTYSVNVTIGSIVIPEFGFGQGIGLPLAVIGIVAVFAVIARRRRE